MLSKYIKLTAALFACSASIPATAAVSILANNVDLSTVPFTVNVGGGSSFTFSYDPNGSFDFDPVYIQTTGNAAVTAFGGFLGIPLAPSTFFTRSVVEIGPRTSPGFASFDTAAEVPYSIVEGDLGLRYTIGTDDYYGYARFGGSLLQTVAFETTANTPILTGSLGAVPEPATWAMMIAGFALAGAGMRRKSVRMAFAA